jgi:site-specific DNA-methyltransferase (adenine-specific)
MTTQLALLSTEETNHEVADGEVTILAPQDALKTLRGQHAHFTVAMLDPWYNRGIGGIQDGYGEFLAELVTAAAAISDHVFLWGFPEIVCAVLPLAPKSHPLVAWLTWYFKNCPSQIRGWRSAQQACLHFATPEAKVHVKHFLNEAQLERHRAGTLRYMPGPPSVIEVPLNIGFVGRKEQTGHPSQKPEAVYEPLLRMTTEAGDSVIDPMCGAGTTGAVARKRGVSALLCDESDEYLKMAERRLGVKRVRRPRKTA